MALLLLHENNCAKSFWNLYIITVLMVQIKRGGRTDAYIQMALLLIRSLVFTCLLYKSFENTVRKGEIARNEQFLLFPHCFLPVWRAFCHFQQNWNCRLQTLSVWKSLEFVIWERVKENNCAKLFLNLSIQKLWSGQIEFSVCQWRSLPHDTVSCKTWVVGWIEV